MNLDDMPVERNFLDGNIVLFGYSRVVQSGGEITGLRGEAPSLDVGMTVTLSGDSQGYVPGGFKDGTTATITGFREPFVRGSTDHIIKVSDGKDEAYVKPSNIKTEGTFHKKELEEANGEGKQETRFDAVQQKFLYGKIKSYSAPDVSPLPDVVKGLSLIGTFKDLDRHMVAVVKADGTPVTILEPVTAVLLGEATAKETKDFIISKLVDMRNGLPPSFGDTESRKEQILAIWERNKEQFEQIIYDETRKVQDLKDAYEQRAFENGTLKDFKRGDGAMFSEFTQYREKIAAETLHYLRAFLKSLSNQFDSVAHLEWRG